MASVLHISARLLLVALCWALAASAAHATMIAEWTFDDGTANDTLGSYDLTLVGGGPTISGGVASFGGADAPASYLETAGPGGNPTWTLALRVRANAPFDQGTFQGIFSNNDSSSAANSWQIENYNGQYQFRTTGGVFSFGTPTGGWDTIVVRKLSPGDADVWLNGVQVVASIGSNPGGLQNFRLGTNRNTNRLYGFDLDFARVFDTVENPLMAPEPGSAVLLGFGLAIVAGIRRRARPRGQSL